MNKNDRDSLIHAAIAEGHLFFDQCETRCPHLKNFPCLLNRKTCRVESFIEHAKKYPNYLDSPLKALELAFNLDIDFWVDGSSMFASSTNVIEKVRIRDRDKFSAMCRAITKVAAEIGREKLANIDQVS